MSFDFATQQICSHQVFFEALDLSGTTGIDSEARDRVTFLRPPSSNAKVKVYVDCIEIPRGGLFSTAQLPFTSPEPYRIRAGVNDLLFIRIGFGAPRYVQLSPGPQVRARDIVRELRKKIPELNVEVKNKRVLFSAKQPSSKTEFSFPDPRWTDPTSSLPNTVRVLNTFSSFGIVPGRSVRGKKVYSGWDIFVDPDSPDGRDKQVVFNEALQNNDPLVQVSYTTLAVDCRRCHGTQIEFDYSIVNNSYEEVRDLDLLSQEFDKFVFTKIGTHFKWNWLGTPLIDRIGGKGTVGGVTVNSNITVDISGAFSVYQNIKTQQDNQDFQNVSDAEYPLSLDSINVQTLPDDPTIAVVTTTIISRTSVPVDFQRVVGNPNPFSLASDPVQNIRLDVARRNEGFLLRG